MDYYTRLVCVHTDGKVFEFCAFRRQGDFTRGIDKQYYHLLLLLFHWKKYSPDGWILEVDVKYVDELHKLHNDYPVTLEKIEISLNILSNYCSDIANKNEIKIGGVHKLIPNLCSKSKYVFHYRNL